MTTYARLSCCAFGLLLVSQTACSQPEALPQFGDYPARAVYSGEPAAIEMPDSLDTPMPGGTTLADDLREAVASGPNFAGALSIVHWGCGTGCTFGYGVVLATGRVVQLPQAFDEYQPGSRLAVSNPPQIVYEMVPEGTPIPEHYATSYWVWDDDGFDLLRTIPASELETMRPGTDR